MCNRSYFRIVQLISFIILLVAFSISGCAKPVHITVLYSNDIHGHILPFDDTRNGKDIGGAARRSTLIQQIKKENPNTIALDAGDLLSGTPISGIFKGEADFGVLQLLGYDAMAIGNHDFDYGQESLRNVIKTSKVPIISANIIETGKDKTLTTPYVILKRGGVKIAVLGLTTPTTPTTTHPKNVIGLSFENPEITAAKFIPVLKKKADIIIVLSHLGFQEDIAFGNGQKDVNIIVGGHSHTKIDHFYQDNTPIIVQDFQWGINLGRLDFDFDKGKVINPKAELIPINSTIADDPAVTTYLKPFTSQITTKMNEKVGETTVDLDKPSRISWSVVLKSLLRKICGLK